MSNQKVKLIEAWFDGDGVVAVIDGQETRFETIGEAAEALGVDAFDLLELLDGEEGRA